MILVPTPDHILYIILYLEFRREPADSLGVWLQAMGIVYLEMVCVRN